MLVSWEWNYNLNSIPVFPIPVQFRVQMDSNPEPSPVKNGLESWTESASGLGRYNPIGKAEEISEDILKYVKILKYLTTKIRALYTPETKEEPYSASVSELLSPDATVLVRVFDVRPLFISLAR